MQSTQNDPNFKSRLSLKAVSLGGLSMSPVIDHAFKIGIPKTTTSVEVDGILSFDGISLRSLDVAEDFRTKLTVKDAGKASLKAVSGAVDIVAEVADVGSKLLLGGSWLQWKKIFTMALKKAGIVGHSGKATFKPNLSVDGIEIGQAEYISSKINSFNEGHAKYLPKAIRTSVLADAELLKKPAIVATSKLSLDLSELVVNNEMIRNREMIRLTIRENVKISRLNPDHRRDVVIRATYSLRVKSGSSLTFQREGSNTLNLGPYEYEIVASSDRTSKTN